MKTNSTAGGSTNLTLKHTRASVLLFCKPMTRFLGSRVMRVMNETTLRFWIVRVSSPQAIGGGHIIVRINPTIRTLMTLRASPLPRPPHQVSSDR